MLQTLQLEVLDLKGNFKNNQQLLLLLTYMLQGQLGQGKIVKFLSKPKELCYSLLPGKVVSISVGETTCAAVTSEFLQLIIICCVIIMRQRGCNNEDNIDHLRKINLSKNMSFFILSLAETLITNLILPWIFFQEGF